MIMSIFELYLLNVLFSLGTASTWIVVVCIIILIIIPLGILIHNDFDFEKENQISYISLKEPYKRVMMIGIPVLILSILTPSKEEAAWIAGGHIITNTEGVGELSVNTVKAINSFLEIVAEKDKD
jgi:hypothetical protein